MEANSVGCFDGPHESHFLAGCSATGCVVHESLLAAQAACLSSVNCGGITQIHCPDRTLGCRRDGAYMYGEFEERSDDLLSSSAEGEVSWVRLAADDMPPRCNVS